MATMTACHLRNRGSFFQVLVSLLIMTAASAVPMARSEIEERLPTAAEMTARLEALEGDETLSTQQRDRIRVEYQGVMESLRAIARHQERLGQLRGEATEAPAKIRQIERKLAENGSSRPIDVAASYETLDQLLSETQVDLRAARARAAAAKQEVGALENAPMDVQAAIASVLAEREAIARQLTELTTARAIAPEQQAHQLALKAELAEKDAHLQALQAERESVQPRLDLARANHRLANAEAESAEHRLVKLEDLLSGRRSGVVGRLRTEALQLRMQADDAPEVLARQLRINAEVAEELAARIAKLGEIAGEQRELRNRIEELRELRATTEGQLEIAQLGGALGRVLHQQRRQLANLTPSPRNQRERAETLALARLDQLQLRARMKADERIEQRLAEYLQGVPDAERAALKAPLREQLRQGLERAEQLDRVYTAYVTDLAALDQLERELDILAEDYAGLLNRDLVWIADAPRPSWNWPLAVVQPLTLLLDGELWWQLASSLAHGWERRPLLLGLTSLLVLGAFSYRRRLRHWLLRLAENSRDPDRGGFSTAVSALLVTLGLALPMPAVLAFAALLLAAGGEAHNPSAALAQGLGEAAVVTAILAFIRALCRDHGLLDGHLDWRPEVRRALIRGLYWVSPVLPICVLVMGITSAAGQHTDTLGRAAFVLGAIAVARFVWTALHPETGVLSGYFVQARQHGWQWNFRRLWLGVLTLLPVSFGVLALFGAYFTAQQLAVRFCATLLLVGSIVVLRQIVLHGLARFEQRLARRQALARRDAARQRKKEGEAQGESTIEITDTQSVDVGSINQQVRAFLRIGVWLLLGIGLWWVWADLLPALGALQKIVLWEYLSGSGDTATVAVVTAAGVGLALLVAVITYLAARNLPGLLEVAILQRLEVDAGARYAANAMSRYLITVVGVLVVINMLGMEWNRLQWLVAALGVGLGFGLQEIVGNFVSGLIILFERPFRIGDTVTVGSVSGTVTRIHIRATTITDWDRKELIVPNKAFITDQVVNWTLSDPVLRVIVRVGIAYGSDTIMARRLLMETAEANARALRDPAPQVWFMGFGDSSLDFEMRVFVMGLPEILPVTHELHEAIDQVFRKHGVEIAFPQRDLHLRSLEPRVAELLRGQSLPTIPADRG